MNDWEEKINALLSDSAQMESISRLAGQLMGGGGSETAAEPAALSAPPLDSAMFSRLGQLLSGGGGGDSDKTALLKAMSAYVSPARRQKMEKAIQFARMAKIAGAALREYGGGDGV